MSIELTQEQTLAIAEAIDDSPWTPGETGLLAGEAFGKLDDTDFSEYLKNP